MVFSSVPAVYLDPPNWNQQQASDQPAGGGGGGGGGGGDAHRLPPPGMGVLNQEAGMLGSIRPGSMADRARLAKVPPPEPALKCPRCDSTNTKFCYFNNYSLSQPRHFCKTCRRYWTRGGALRNVPVGGGCRRNKRSKGTGSSAKSSATSASTSSASSTATTTVSGAIPSNMAPMPQLPFMTASLHPLADYGPSGLGLNFTGIQSMDAVDYQVGSSSSVGLEQWRLQQFQQFPFFGGLELQPPPAAMPGLFPFDGEVGVGGDHGYGGQVHHKHSSSGLISQLASVKMEDNNHGLSLPRQSLSMPGNDPYWSGGSTGSGWASDVSGSLL